MKLVIYIALTLGLLLATLNVKSMEPNFYSLVSYQITTVDSLSDSMDDFLNQLSELTKKNQVRDLLHDETTCVHQYIEPNIHTSCFISFSYTNMLEVFAVNYMEQVSIMQEIKYYMPNMHN